MKNSKPTKRPERALLRAMDEGIRPYVQILRDANVETYESCEGGKGHSFPEPTVRFFGERAEGLRALSVALQHALPVRELRRFWSVIDGEATGPDWELVFGRRPSHSLLCIPNVAFVT